MSKIEWCDETVNPWVGCNKVSPACDNCYAEAAARRLGHLLPEGQTRDAYRSVIGGGGRWNGKVAQVESGWAKLRSLARSKKPMRIFVGSMTDVLHREVPDCILDRLLTQMLLSEQHTWLLLTKRPGWLKRPLFDRARCLEIRNAGNIWLGATAESQESFDRRVHRLRGRWPGPKFVSCEPLLGPIDFGDNLGPGKIEWVIAGCESGRNARPSDPDWFRSLRDQAKAAEVPFMLKQIGDGKQRLRGEDALLDGRAWLEFPEGSGGVA